MAANAKGKKGRDSDELPLAKKFRNELADMRVTNKTAVHNELFETVKDLGRMQDGAAAVLFPLAKTALVKKGLEPNSIFLSGMAKDKEWASMSDVMKALSGAAIEIANVGAAMLQEYLKWMHTWRDHLFARAPVTELGPADKAYFFAHTPAGELWALTAHHALWSAIAPVISNTLKHVGEVGWLLAAFANHVFLNCTRALSTAVKDLMRTVGTGSRPFAPIAMGAVDQLTQGLSKLEELYSGELTTPFEYGLARLVETFNAAVDKEQPRIKKSGIKPSDNWIANELEKSEEKRSLGTLTMDDFHRTSRAERKEIALKPPIERLVRELKTLASDNGEMYTPEYLLRQPEVQAAVALDKRGALQKALSAELIEEAMNSASKEKELVDTLQWACKARDHVTQHLLNHPSMHHLGQRDLPKVLHAPVNFLDEKALDKAKRQQQSNTAVTPVGVKVSAPIPQAWASLAKLYEVLRKQFAALALRLVHAEAAQRSANFRDRMPRLMQSGKILIAKEGRTHGEEKTRQLMATAKSIYDEFIPFKKVESMIAEIVSPRDKPKELHGRAKQLVEQKKLRLARPHSDRAFAEAPALAIPRLANTVFEEQRHVEGAAEIDSAMRLRAASAFEMERLSEERRQLEDKVIGLQDEIHRLVCANPEIVRLLAQVEEIHPRVMEIESCRLECARNIAAQDHFLATLAPTERAGKVQGEPYNFALRGEQLSESESPSYRGNPRNMPSHGSQIAGAQRFKGNVAYEPSPSWSYGEDAFTLGRDDTPAEIEQEQISRAIRAMPAEDVDRLLKKPMEFRSRVVP